MLHRLHIENVALIVSCDIELGTGLNILSGETGAGKSIVIDAINFLFGSRADKTLIRFGERMAKVQAVFDNLNEETLSCMADLGLEHDEQLILTRSMSNDGRGDIRANGESITLGMLRKLSVKLFDIVGQHDNQFLLKPMYHIDIVDSFGADKIAEQKKRVAALYAEYTDVVQRIQGFSSAAERARRIDLLRYQTEEIEKAGLHEGEEEELRDKKKLMSCTERIVSALYTATEALNGDSGGALSAVNMALNELNGIQDLDSELAECHARLDSIKADLKDIAYTTSGMIGNYEFSPAELDRVEDRLATLKSLRKKYGATVSDILDFYASADAELASLLNAEESLGILENKRIDLLTKLYNASTKLSKYRHQTATGMCMSILSELQELGMKGTRFDVSFAPVPEEPEDIDYTANGYDKLEFSISPNPGAPMMPLHKIASGGEMNRIMLAIKVVLSRAENISTIIFDEIDSGISGGVAQTVAEKLYRLGTEKQVVAVTHLAQLAAMSDVHFKIEKSVLEGTTKTFIRPLEYAERVTEIARLVGAVGNAETATKHADSMLENAARYKKSL